jgi:HD-GYP domain-containing protein (c-di-GMP phosphodiesterase class II)
MADQPALLYFSKTTAGSEKVREALTPLGLRVLRADEPSDALGHLMDERVGLLLLDGPSLATFTERLFRQWREHDPLLECIGIAGASDRTEPALTRMSCRHVIRPPLDPGGLRDAITRTLELREQRAALVRGDETVASLVLQATQALVTAVELKDAYTRGRADRVALFAGILADEAGGADTDRVRTAARIMDVGKTGVPEDILNKTDRLSDDEFDQIKRHPVISWEMLRHLFRDEVVLGVARHHHERWDGKGYPDGLAGEDIPYAARIAAIADSLDAITSTRAFRQARLWSDAVDEIVQGSGTRYDPDLVDVFRQAKDRLLVGA